MSVPPEQCPQAAVDAMLARYPDETAAAITAAYAEARAAYIEEEAAAALAALPTVAEQLAAMRRGG